MALILGSQSPRRKEILHFFSVPFQQISPDFSEKDVPFSGDSIAYVQALAKGKAASIATKYPQATILAADTCVFKEGKIFEKPIDDQDAFNMLKELNGSWHTVITAITVQKGEQTFTSHEETRVLFHQLTHSSLKSYHHAFHAMDKAGGYGIQKSGSIIVKRIEGCFYNVMGLPISTTCQMLKKMDIDLWNHLN